MLNEELLLQMMMVALVTSGFTTLFVQKFKELEVVTKGLQVVFCSLTLNILSAFGFCFILTDLLTINTFGFITVLLVGLISFVGASAFYEKLHQLGVMKSLTETNYKESSE